MLGGNYILLDVRSPREFREGHLRGSINIPFYDVSKKIKRIVPNKESKILVYCQSGHRSKRVVEWLIKNGYKNVEELIGGLDEL